MYIERGFMMHYIAFKIRQIGLREEEKVKVPGSCDSSGDRDPHFGPGNSPLKKQIGATEKETAR